MATATLSRRVAACSNSVRTISALPRLRAAKFDTSGFYAFSRYDNDFAPNGGKVVLWASDDGGGISLSYEADEHPVQRLSYEDFDFHCWGKLLPQ